MRQDSLSSAPETRVEFIWRNKSKHLSAASAITSRGRSLLRSPVSSGCPSCGVEVNSPKTRKKAKGKQISVEIPEWVEEGSFGGNLADCRRRRNNFSRAFSFASNCCRCQWSEPLMKIAFDAAVGPSLGAKHVYICEWHRFD